MRGLCLLLAGLCCLTLTGGEAAGTQRSLLTLLHHHLKPVNRPQSLIILQPVHAHTRPVYKPVYPAPSKPVYKPVYPAPTKPVYKPVYPAPARPVYPAPTQPVYPAPIQPVHPAPGQPGPVGGLLLSWQVPQLTGRTFTWQQADNECRQRNLHLVSIEDQRKNDIIRNLLASHGRKFIWTSGRLDSSGWIWTSGGRPVVYTNWGIGDGGRPQPDNSEGNEYCLAVLNKFYPGDGITWHDIGCHHVKDFICE